MFVYACVCRREEEKDGETEVRETERSANLKYL